MGRFLVAHYREVRRFAWFEAETAQEAIEKAQEDENEANWEIEDDDPGEYNIREVAKEST